MATEAQGGEGGSEQDTELGCWLLPQARDHLPGNCDPWRLWSTRRASAPPPWQLAPPFSVGDAAPPLLGVSFLSDPTRAGRVQSQGLCPRLCRPGCSCLVLRQPPFHGPVLKTPSWPPGIKCPPCSPSQIWLPFFLSLSSPPAVTEIVCGFASGLLLSS